MSLFKDTENSSRVMSWKGPVGITASPPRPGDTVKWKRGAVVMSGVVSDIQCGAVNKVLVEVKTRDYEPCEEPPRNLSVRALKIVRRAWEHQP